MAPPVPTIPLTDLEKEINVLASGKARKPPVSNLRDCPLKELTQYKCNVRQPATKGQKAVIVCEPFVRMYRVCENGLHVETTAWESWKTSHNGKGSA